MHESTYVSLLTLCVKLNRIILLLSQHSRAAKATVLFGSAYVFFSDCVSYPPCGLYRRTDYTVAKTVLANYSLMFSWVEDKADLLCRPVFSLSHYGGGSGSTWLYVSHSWHLTDGLRLPSAYPVTRLPLSVPSVYSITVVIAFIHTGNFLGRYLAQPALCGK